MSLQRDLDEEDLYLPRQAQSGNADWMMSYADIATALMCFFLIFFATSNIQKEESVIESLIVSLNNESSSGAAGENKDGFGGSGEQAGSTEGTLTGAGGAGSVIGVDPDTPKKDLFSYLKNREGIKVSKFGRSVVVDFNEGQFFGSASTKLSRDGWSKISEFAKLIAPFKNKVFIEIQGHSDSTPVIQKRNRAFVNNTELSVLRATDVFRRFEKLGYSHQGLAVSGFGESYEIRGQDGQSSKAKSRRISFRITERGVDDI